VNCFELRDSNVHGSGIFASKKIEKNTVLFPTHKRLRGAVRWINLSPNCMYNHSSKPNCESVTDEGYKRLVTLRDVEEDEELLVDYTKDEELEQPKDDWVG